MPYKRRVDTLRVLVGGHAILTGSTRLTAITGEINRITQVGRLGNHNGWLLSVLHTTRALDTALSVLVMHKGWDNTARSLGQYLAALRQGGVLSPSEKSSFDTRLVHKRNKYMHEAGAMPDHLEADRVLNEMHACLATILGRI
jgi:hypothetical protein